MNLNLKPNNMKPVNTKSMFSLLCLYMEKLDSGEVDSSQACAMSKLIGQAENLLTYELKRAALLSNAEFEKHFRNIEIKAFDSIPETFTIVGKDDKLQTEVNKLALELKEFKESMK
jgi:hypothetical protein